jgi:hypothetical protein
MTILDVSSYVCNRKVKLRNPMKLPVFPCMHDKSSHLSESFESNSAIGDIALCSRLRYGVVRALNDLTASAMQHCDPHQCFLIKNPSRNRQHGILA